MTRDIIAIAINDARYNNCKMINNKNSIILLSLINFIYRTCYA